ncbi:MAG: DUF805 domain-containing protein [Rickettsiales bacterium]|nr:DUF805 domain-containing protein [Rickettsiales bacterium]
MNPLKYFAAWKLPSRINRTKYCAINLIYLIAIFIPIFIYALSTALLPKLTEHTNSAIMLFTLILGGFFIAFCIFIIISLYILIIKRLHDINLSGWYLTVYILPIIGVLLRKYSIPAISIPLELVGLIFSLVILLVRGTEGPNKFGSQPSKSPRSEYILTFIFVPLYVVLLLCDIVIRIAEYSSIDIVKFLLQ